MDARSTSSVHRSCHKQLSSSPSRSRSKAGIDNAESAGVITTFKSPMLTIQRQSHCTTSTSHIPSNGGRSTAMTFKRDFSSVCSRRRVSSIDASHHPRALWEASVAFHMFSKSGSTASEASEGSDINGESNAMRSGREV